MMFQNILELCRRLRSVMRVQVFLCIVLFGVACLYFISSSSSLGFDWSANLKPLSLIGMMPFTNDSQRSEMGGNSTGLGFGLDSIAQRLKEIGKMSYLKDKFSYLKNTISDIHKDGFVMLNESKVTSLTGSISVDTTAFAGESTDSNVDNGTAASITRSLVKITTSTNTSSYTEKSDVSVEENTSEEVQGTLSDVISNVEYSQSNTDKVSSDGAIFQNETITLSQNNKSEISEQNPNNTETTEFSTDLLERFGFVTKPPPADTCPRVPPNLVGPVLVMKEELSFEEIASQNPGLKPGGLYSPPDCKPRHRVAIVIPYRNRESHLKVLLHNLHPILMRQQLDYGIYIIDQAPPTKFNRALLMNIGFVEAFKRHDYQCVIFHDVDLVPENDENIYSCPESPRHMSAAVDKFNYRIPYADIFGGVSALSKEHFEMVNGYSNLYFGWGGEDDDMRSRIDAKSLRVIRYPIQIARYSMIRHGGDKHNDKNPKRFSLLKYAKQRMKYDGLNKVNEFYTVQEIEELPTHTRIAVVVDDSINSKQFDYKTGRVHVPVSLTKKKVVHFLRRKG